MATKATMIDAVKIQARVVIPIVKALELELGRERAHEIVGEAIAGSPSTSEASANPPLGASSHVASTSRLSQRCDRIGSSVAPKPP
jgi:hypothetical protein